MKHVLAVGVGFAPLFGSKGQEMKEATPEWVCVLSPYLLLLSVTLQMIAGWRVDFRQRRFAFVFVSDCMCYVRRCFALGQLYRAVCLLGKYDYKNGQTINVCTRLQGNQVWNHLNTFFKAMFQVPAAEPGSVCTTRNTGPWGSTSHDFCLDYH